VLAREEDEHGADDPSEVPVPRSHEARGHDRGSLEMTITAEGAQGKFVPGKDYFLDFTPAE
jgi:hypothetical protein